jgi:hypothetical protein
MHDSTCDGRVRERICFSYKKPKGVPHKFNPQMQQAFIEHYNKTLKNSEDPVLFMDAVHPTQSTKLSCAR